MKRGVIATLLTVLFAAAAAAGVFLYVQNVRNGTEAAQQTVQVLVAADDIPAGLELDELVGTGFFVKKDVAQEDLVQAAITDEYQLEGQRTAYPILAGEQISAARLEGTLEAEGGRFGLVGGTQGVALTLEAQRAAGGILQRGDHVEAFGTFKDAKSQLLTRFVVLDAEVLSVSRDETAGSRGVTLLLAVTPEEAQLLVYAQEAGTVWLTLLPPNETGAALSPVRPRDLR